MTDYTSLIKEVNIPELVRALREAPSDWYDVDLHYKAAATIEKLEAEVKRLKECNDELREAQTYIDHYGDKWLTSAKDVPTSAYNHGYMDGKNEAEPHWMSVKENPPKPYEEVWLRINGGFCAGYMHSDGGFTITCPSGFKPGFNEPALWMSIEPPREVQE